MTTAEAQRELEQLDARAVFLDEEEYERRCEDLMSIIAADPNAHDPSTVLWRLSHPTR